MDEKVLNLLIDRLVTSSQMVAKHNNKVWEECLENDKKTLREYYFKNKEMLSYCFKFFVNGDDPEGKIIFTATKIDSENYQITWTREGYQHLTKYSIEDVAYYVNDGSWKVVIED